MSLQVTNKQIRTSSLAVKDYVRLIALEGPSRGSKTADIIQAFYYAVFDSEERYHAICGQNYDTINRNILYAQDVGLIETHPELVIKKKQNGGYYISMQSPMGEKEILIASYGDASKWKKILGGTIGVFLIDEANIANKDFIDETFARQLSCEHPKTFLTLNGDDPLHLIYQEIINYCKIVGDCPSSTRALMNEFQEKKGIKQGYYYIFYKMSDNPIMTPDKIERAMSIYPVGSYYYITKLLGERGKQGNLIYSDYMSPDLLVDAFAKDSFGRSKYPMYRYTIGIDIGETRAANVFSLVGWAKNYESCIVLACFPFVRVGYNIKRQKLNEWLDMVKNLVNVMQIEAIFVDSAESNFIIDLQEPVKQGYGLDVLPSYKATIKQRIDAFIVGLSTGRIKFNKNCQNAYDAYNSAVWVKDKIGLERLDDNSVKIDIMDSIEYAVTRHMKALMSSIGGWK